MTRQTEQVRVRLRRAPKLLPFAVSGAVLGVVAAAVWSLVAMAQPADDAQSQTTRQLSPMQAFGLLAVVLALAGVAVMLVIALVIDRVSARRARLVDAVHERVTPVAPADRATATAEGGAGREAAHGETLETRGVRGPRAVAPERIQDARSDRDAR